MTAAAIVGSRNWKLWQDSVGFLFMLIYCLVAGLVSFACYLLLDEFKTCGGTGPSDSRSCDGMLRESLLGLGLSSDAKFAIYCWFGAMNILMALYMIADRLIFGLFWHWCWSRGTHIKIPEIGWLLVLLRHLRLVSPSRLFLEDGDASPAWKRWGTELSR